MGFNLTDHGFDLTNMLMDPDSFQEHNKGPDEPACDLLQRLQNQKLILDWWSVGSRRTCRPAPIHTDDDYLVYVDDLYSTVIKIRDLGFVITGSLIADEVGNSTNQFHSLRWGDVNLIISDNKEFTARFLAATDVAGRLNLQDKSDRIALFQAVLYGNPGLGIDYSNMDPKDRAGEEHD